jgi:hypothetical protein
MLKLEEGVVSLYHRSTDPNCNVPKIFDLLTNGQKDENKVSIKLDVITNIIARVKESYYPNEEHPVIAAVHWGGLDNADSQSYTNKFNDYLDKIDNADIRLAYFSKTLPSLDNLEELKKIFYDQIWGSSKKEVELQNLKNKVFNHWVPLAIDMRGLSDVEENRRAIYYNDIRKDILENRNTLKDGWDKMKPELLMIVDTFDPYSIVNDICLSEFGKFCSKYNKSEGHFLLLPNWLDKVVKEIDKKIAEVNKQQTNG